MVAPTARYTPYSPPAGEEPRDCSICMETVTPGTASIRDLGTEAVAHGNLHPMHRKCAAAWTQTNPVCPTCRTPVDPASLISWKDRALVLVTVTGSTLLLGAIGDWPGAATGAIVSISAVSAGLWGDIANEEMKQMGQALKTILMQIGMGKGYYEAVEEMRAAE